MSRLGTNRNVQWTAECVKISLCSRAPNFVNLSSLRWGYFDERIKQMKEIFFERNEKMYFWQKPEGVILHVGNFDSTKSNLHTYVTLWGRMLFVSFFSSEKTQLQFGRKWKKFRKIFSLLYLLKKIQSGKKFAITFSLKRRLHKPRKTNETINPIFGLGQIHELKWKRTNPFFWKLFRYFWQKNEGVILDDGNFVGLKSSLNLCCPSRKRTVSVSFISFEKFELRMRKNFSKIFLCSFLPKNTKYEKNCRHFWFKV